jgi:hypothetical protein
MAANPEELDPAEVRKMLTEHRDMTKRRVELEGLLERLKPAWAELRDGLNELSRLSEE